MQKGVGRLERGSFLYCLDIFCDHQQSKLPRRLKKKTHVQYEAFWLSRLRDRKRGVTSHATRKY